MLTVMEGKINVQLDAEDRRLEAGEGAVIPRGTPHRFYNAEGGSARLLMLILPGGHELYLSELARLQERKALNPRSMSELSQQYGVELLQTIADPPGR
jgi:hypothetical protein